MNFEVHRIQSAEQSTFVFLHVTGSLRLERGKTKNRVQAFARPWSKRVVEEEHKSIFTRNNPFLHCMIPSFCCAET